MIAEHVYRKFPNHIDTIQKLLQKDATFREICEDYEEACTWLDDYCRSKGGSSTDCDQTREVIRELEDEIIIVLRDAGYQPP